MNSRWLRISVLLWTCLWFGVILPGHQRGVITVPGTHVTVVPSCCSPHPSDAADKPGDSKHAPPGDQARDCYVCHMAARLDMPGAVTLPLTFLTATGELAPQRACSLTPIWFVPVVQGRGPPVA